jgi:hypothetical protein
MRGTSQRQQDDNLRRKRKKGFIHTYVKLRQ